MTNIISLIVAADLLRQGRRDDRRARTCCGGVIGRSPALLLPLAGLLPLGFGWCAARAWPRRRACSASSSSRPRRAGIDPLLVGAVVAIAGVGRAAPCRRSPPSC